MVYEDIWRWTEDLELSKNNTTLGNAFDRMRGSWVLRGVKL